MKKRHRQPPEDKAPRRPRKWRPDPWNRPYVELELYISPELKLKLGLPHRTTEEALEERKEP